MQGNSGDFTRFCVTKRTKLRFLYDISYLHGLYWIVELEPPRDLRKYLIYVTKFLLSIESVLDSFGFTKQRGICDSLRLTPFLRFFRKAGEIKIRRRALWGV